MEALATLNNQRQFDFQNNGIEVMDLETLQRTYKENDIYGNPVRGIYHYQVIQRMMDICRRHNLNYEVEEIFAAQNKNRTQPGVVILPQVEQTYGEKAVEAHVLRRIFTTIRILNGDTDELTTTLVVAYHQDGIQAAIGPCVRICHNQCILSPERSVANYGKDKVTTEELFGKVDDWMRNFERDMDADRSRIQRLKEKVLTPGELYMIIGMLTALRVSHDSADKRLASQVDTYPDRSRIQRLKEKVLTPGELYMIIGMLTALRVSHDSADKRLASQVDTYPLNQGQISVFTEELLKLSLEQPRITAWDVYNVATEIYKPGKTDFPAMIPQNGAMADFLLSYNQN